MTRTDPRARQLAETMHQIVREKATKLPEWKDLPLQFREQAVTEARLWLRAAVQAGIVPDAELKRRSEVVQSFRELAAQARADRDFEGEASVLGRLAEREQQWARIDAAGEQPDAKTETRSGDDYERTTGHLITCLAVAGGAADPDCPHHAPVVPSADRAALRDRIAEALCPSYHRQGSMSSTDTAVPALRPCNLHVAEAGTVLSVLPDPAAAPVDDTAPDAWAPAGEQPEADAPTEEQVIREHVTTLHLIGEQITSIESWMWQRLADVRAAAAVGLDATPRPSLRERHRAAWNALTPAEQAARLAELDADDTDEQQDGAQPCAECGHPKDAHREGDDPVTPGVCTACPEDDGHHDHQQAKELRP